MASTKDVVANHLKCFGEGDLEGILSDYAPDAILVTPNNSVKGPAAIRPLFVSLIEEFQKSGATLQMQKQFVDGEFAYIVWTSETNDNIYELATDTFVVRNGKIAAQTFTPKTTPRT